MNDNGRKPLGILVGQIYEAGLDPSLWPDTVTGISAEVGAALSALFYRDEALSGDGLAVIGLSGYPASAVTAYATYYAARDVRSPTIARLRSDEIYLDGHQIGFEHIKGSEIYNDLFRPLDGGQAIAAKLFSDARRFCVVSAHRSIRGGAVSDIGVERFRDLVPHIRRALQIHRQLCRARALADSVATALDRSPVCVLITEKDGRVVWMNTAAGSLLRRPCCPLTVESSRLTAKAAEIAALIRSDLDRAAAIGRGATGAPPRVRRLPSVPEGDGSIGLMVAPVRRTDLMGLSVAEPLALVFLSDPSSSPPVAAEALARQFGLSLAEAQVVAGLAVGESVDAIADERQVSRETVRTQLRSIFSKTETHSQSQLVSLALRGLAALTRTGP